MNGSLLIIAAPSGGGKTSLVRALLARESNVRLSVSHTTRQPRVGEEDGIHYHFVSHAQFDQYIKKNTFLEYAHVHGNCYGTTKSSVEPVLKQGFDVLLEIDYQGARRVRELMPECVSIFILPPSREELENRLRHRAQDTEEIIQYRLNNSREEMAHADEFDFVVVNHQFEQALEELITIVRCQRLRTCVRKTRLQELMTQLTQGAMSKL